jgi:hypothetical protein
MLAPGILFSPSVRLPGKRFNRDSLHVRLPLPLRPCFCLGAIFEDPIAGCLAVAICDDYAKVMMFAFCFFLLGHAGL